MEVKVGDVLKARNGHDVVVYRIIEIGFFAVVDGLRHMYTDDGRHFSCKDRKNSRTMKNRDLDIVDFEISEFKISDYSLVNKQLIWRLAKIEQDIQETVRDMIVGKRAIVQSEEFNGYYSSGDGKSLKNHTLTIRETYVDQGDVWVWLEDYPCGISLHDIEIRI